MRYDEPGPGKLQLEARAYREGLMTETQWLACNDPWLMLDQLNRKVGDRKLRLLAAAVYRRLRTQMDEPVAPDFSIVQVVEQYADHRGTLSELREAYDS